MHPEKKDADIIKSSDIMVTLVELPTTVTFEKLKINTTNFHSTECFILKTVAEYKAVVIPDKNMVFGPTIDSSNHTEITPVLHCKLYFYVTCMNLASQHTEYNRIIFAKCTKIVIIYNELREDACLANKGMNTHVLRRTLILTIEDFY